MRKKRSIAADNFTRGIELVKQQTRTQMRSLVSFSMLIFITGIGLWLAYLMLFLTKIQLDAETKWLGAWLNIHAFDNPSASIVVTTTAGTELWPAPVILENSWFQSMHKAAQAVLLDGFLFSIVATFVIAVGSIYTLSRHGKEAHADDIVRGPITVDGKELARIVRKKGDASRLVVGDVPLLASAETAHLLLMGTTGVGKSQALFRFMDALVTAGDAAIVYDRTGQMVEKYFDPSRGDIILNPFDERSPPWSPWAEIRSIADPERLAAAFIPPGQGDGAFFNEAARALLTALLIRIGRHPDRSVLTLLQAALQWPLDMKRSLLRGTEAEKFYKDDSRAGHDIDMIMSTYTRSLRYLPAISGRNADFSIRAHIETLDQYKSRKPWLFFAGKAEDMDAVRPLLTCWIDVVCAAIMGSGERLDRRIWILLDEWQTLQEVPKLHDILAEGRKYGAAVIAGNQNLKQLEDIYGRSKAATMLSLFNTKVIFRVPEPESAEWCQNQLGQAVWERPQESVRFATSSVMDGVTMQSQRQQEAIVMASEIVALPTLECYVQLPGDYPVAHTKLPDPKRFKRPTRAARLIERPLSETVFEALDTKDTATTPPQTDKPEGPTPNQLDTEKHIPGTLPDDAAPEKDPVLLADLITPNGIDHSLERR